MSSAILDASITEERARSLFIDLQFAAIIHQQPQATSFAECLRPLLVNNPKLASRMICYKQIRDANAMPENASQFLIAREVEYLVACVRPGVAEEDWVRHVEGTFRKHGEEQLADAYARDPEAFRAQCETGWRTFYLLCHRDEEAAVPPSWVNDFVKVVAYRVHPVSGRGVPYVMAQAIGERLIVEVFPSPIPTGPNAGKPAPLLFDLATLRDQFDDVDSMTWLIGDVVGEQPHVQLSIRHDGHRVELSLFCHVHPQGAEWILPDGRS